MKMAVELSLYPLDGPLEKTVWGFIEQLIDDNSVTVATNSMSTQIIGDSADVFRVIQTALELSYSKFGRQVLVAKFIPEHVTEIQAS
jgi:uncharacterized protein YqgV (UPF0045/DUF77 family)